jgi:hypothetical protein
VRCSTSPDDGVRGRAGRVALGLVRGARDRGVDLLERDRAALVEVQRLQVAEDHAGVLARHVAEDHVAVRAAGGTRKLDNVDHRGRAIEDVPDLVREVGRRDDPQVDHAAGRLPGRPQTDRFGLPSGASLTRSSRPGAERHACKIACRFGDGVSLVWSQIRVVGRPVCRTLRVPSDPVPSLPNTCSPRRSRAARRSVRSASWCARPLTRPSRSRRWVRHRPRGRFSPGSPPPPRASTRTAGHSIVTRACADQDRSRHAHRSASRRYPISRHGAPDHPAHRRPVWEDGRAGRAGAGLTAPEAPTHLGRLRAARALGAAAPAPCDSPRGSQAAARSASDGSGPRRGTDERQTAALTATHRGSCPIQGSS